MDKAEEELLEYAKMLEDQHFTDDEAFQYLLLEFCGTPYVWGKATTEQSDCSGTICACLNALYRTQRRVTADTLYRICFTRTPVRHEGIQALFFLDSTGRAVHVSGYAGNGDYLNESSKETNKCGTLRTEAELIKKYSWLTPVRRVLSKEAWR
jgi:cell wall-associated NlpC family hydrolase